jgi:hypothetical protein
VAEWTTIAVPLAGGLDTKTDSKVVLPTKMTVLENAEFTKGGSVKKRPGYTAHALQSSAGVAVEGALGLGTRNDELLVMTKDAVHSYDAKTESFQNVGAYCPVTWRATAVVNNTAQQTRGDCATNGGITVYAWQDSRGGVRYAVYDDVTKAAFTADTVLDSSNASQPKVTAIGDNILVTWADTSANDIKAKLIRPGALSASLASSTIDLVTNFATTADYDIVGGSAGGWILFEDSGATGLLLGPVSTAGALGTTVVVTASAIEQCVALAHNETSGKLLVGYSLTADGDATVKEYSASTLGVTGVSVTQVMGGTLTGISLAAMDDGGISMWSSQTSGGAITSYWNYRTAAGVTTSGSVLKANVCSSGFNYEDRAFVILAYDSPTGLQDSYFLYRHDGILMGRLFYQEGNGLIRDSSTCFGPRVSALSETTFQCLLEYRRGLATDKGDTKDVVGINAHYAHVGLRRVILDMEPTPSTATLDGTMYMSGSMLWAFDGGAHPVEANPLLWPEFQGNTGGATQITQSGGGAIVSGVTHNYRIYAEATLANGQRVRSAAITRSYTTANTNKILVAVPQIPFTRHNGVERPDLRFVVYRTEANKADLYYRVSSPDPSVSGDNGYFENDPTAASATFTDNMTDATLITKEIDYQSTGELPHFAPDGTSFLTVAQSRLFLTGGGTKPNNVIPSLLHFDGEPVHFNDSLNISETPDYGGEVVGAAPLNDVVIVFKERAIVAVAGNGPDNTNQNGFFEVRAISTDMGCSDPGTIVALPIGVMFKSRKGFHLLTPDFQVTYVGADVEAYNSTTFVGAAPVPDSNQVIFVSSTGNAVLFDWYYKAWSVFTNHTGLAAKVWNEDTFVYLRTDGSVYFRESDIFTDGGTPYALKIRTAPIRPETGVQGFWLCRRVNVLGDYRSLHRLRVGVYYDRDEAPFETFTVTAADLVETDTYGDDVLYGDADYYGGDIASSEYQFQFKPRRSKAQTIRFEFTDIPGGGRGAAYEITELALEVGLNKGIARLPAARKV